jgi:alkaline phosphatase D
MKRRSFLSLAFRAPFVLPFLPASVSGLLGPQAHARSGNAAAFADQPIQSLTPLKRLAFGSCNNERGSQRIWQRMLDHNVELFAWLGDNVYADTEDMQEMAATYQRQLSHPEYQRFVANVPVIGTWDDHDFGVNDGGKEYPQRAGSQQQLLNFLGEDSRSVRRFREGVYASYDIGPEGRQIRVILLDTRYHRDRPHRPGSDILGAAQWSWLEQQLQSSRAQANLIVSSISVLSERIAAIEQWANFPSSHARLFQLIQRTRAQGVLFLAGDRHFAGMLSAKPLGGTKYYELMSSGLNKAMTTGATVEVFKRIYGKQNCAFGNNFGLLEFDWERPEPELVFTAEGERRSIGLRKKFALKAGVWHRLS